MERLGGQWRSAGGMGGVIGLDLNAAFSLGAAMGVDAFAVAVFLPPMERAALVKINKRVTDGSDDD